MYEHDKISSSSAYIHTNSEREREREKEHTERGGEAEEVFDTIRK